MCWDETGSYDVLKKFCMQEMLKGILDRQWSREVTFCDEVETLSESW